jgi:radical SAM superfamily enzyme YgiQ (UPF0313 family)
MMPPCDLASIAAVLQQEGIECRILDMRLSPDPLYALKREVDVWRPDAIITNMGTASAKEDYEILRVTREGVDKRICFCFHAMALPEELFEQGATHILVGDPEYGVAAAVRGDDGGKGIWTKMDTTGEPGWIESLNDLPYPALDLLDINAYHTLIMGKEPFSILLANRGCSYQCPYCVIPFLFGRKVRTMSVQRIVGEIERDMKEFNIRSFFFIDSAINLKPKWTAQFCEEVLRRNLKIRWCSNMRVPPVSRELLVLMKRSGCFRLFYGVEDLDLIDELNRKTTREATREAFELTKEVGIETVAFIILFPGVDRSERQMARRIIKMVKGLKATALQCNLAIPYPGSKMYDEYTKRYDMSKNWSLYDPAGNQVPYPSELDLVKVRRMVYLQFFVMNPRYVWTTLRNAGLRSILAFLKNSSRLLIGGDGRRGIGIST